MTIRTITGQIAAVLLLTGPALAGLAGFGWGMVLPFVLLFTLWMLARAPQDQAMAAGPVSLLAGLAVHLLVVIMIMAFCLGLGAVANIRLDLNPVIPLIVSLMGVMVMRQLNPVEIPARPMPMRETAPHTPPAPSPASPSETVIAALLDLSDTANPAEAVALLEALLAARDPRPGLTLLAEALAGSPGEAHLALRQALILWTADPARFAAGAVPGGLRVAFAAAGQEEHLLGQLLPPALHLARCYPGRQDRFPSVAVLEDIARRSATPALRGALARLVAELSRPSRPAAAPPAAA